MSGAAISPAVAERAVEWLLELQSPPVSPATLSAWNDWRQADPMHEAAWQRIESLTQRLSLGNSAARSALVHAGLQQSDGVSRRNAIKSLAVLLCAGGAAWSMRDSVPWQQWTADYRTSVGEQRRVTLADGSGVLLNTDSAIDFSLDENTRRLRLIEGEILVQAHSEARPLLTQTAEGEVRTTAARFAVRQFPFHSQLIVHQGQVQVTPAQAPHSVREIGAGQWVRFTRHEVLQSRTLVENDLAWADGMFIASNQRLADFLAELSRYRRGRLACDPALASLRVSGTYPLADTDRVLDSLSQSLHLEQRRFTRYWVELRPQRSA
ncbi:MAG: DUF4880 domain-containing protein [Pseudomonas sp.]